MRASIPALVLMFLFVIDALKRSYSKRSRVYLTAAVAALAVGLVTPAHEIVRTVSETSRIYTARKETVRLKGCDTERVLRNQYESADAEKSLFCQYIAR